MIRTAARKGPPGARASRPHAVPLGPLSFPAILQATTLAYKNRNLFAEGRPSGEQGTLLNYWNNSHLNHQGSRLILAGGRTGIGAHDELRMHYRIQQRRTPEIGEHP